LNLVFFTAIKNLSWNTMGVSILLADDHTLFAFGIRKILEMLPEFDFVGHVENGQEAIFFLERNQRVDVLVLDLNMPVMDGLQLLPHLNRKFPGLKKIVLTGHHTRSTMQICKNLGVNGFIGKGSCFEVFRDALEIVASGGEYFQLMDYGKQLPADQVDCLYRKLRENYLLSDRETEVLQMILNQCLTREIAEKLVLSPLTVKTHRRNIFQKLKVRNVTGLLALIKDHPGL
jgi:DNA-binding NarL/FixJ family response regulator